MSKLIGEGTLFQIESETPGTFTTIGQRVSISGPSRSVESVDETDLDSAAVRRRPDTIPDSGEVSLEIFWDPGDATHTILEELMAVPENVNWRLVFNNRTGSRPHRAFSGHLTGFDASGMEKGSDLMASLTIAIDGEITAGTTTIA